MATAITATKNAINKLDVHLLERENSSDGTFEITCVDPSNVIIFLDMTTSATGNVQVFVSASTEGEFTGEGLGDFNDMTTGGAGGGEHYSFGPFEGFRFQDVSTGRIINLAVCSTTAGAGTTGALIKGGKVSAVEIVPSTA